MQPREVIRDLVAGIAAYDAREAADQASVLAWIDSGAPIFRAGPAAPVQHLCVYAALFDESRRALLLVDHIKAGLWLLPGGHVEVDEDPRVAVVREAAEELGITARPAGAPLFLSVTRTRGEDSHLDVTLWFVLPASMAEPITADRGEVRGFAWLGLHGPWGEARFDPQLSRFVAKLATTLGSTG